ncbi:hypothetical protein ACFVUH_08460 [Kitasatospora sp. NPDC058032]|uniref:hypothetical protein n=1 Tax=Kitasatospora sp. NPDC058032 TaxID=3346307 RepID=UPI0036DE7D77
MPVKTTWAVTHTCGDSTDYDLSSRPADQRAGYARWLAGRDCTDCWKAQRDTAGAADRAAWLENKRAEEQQAATSWAAKFRMPPLGGPERALAWGERSRHQLMTSAYRVLVAEGALGESGWQEIEDRARTVDRAGWWIDQRDAAPADLPELLEAATDTDRSTENPY